MKTNSYILDKPKEECGVFGIFGSEITDIAHTVYYGLYALQHRGQESAGIAVTADNAILHHKGMGLAPEVFSPLLLNRLQGESAIGHVRYSTTGGSCPENAQPMVVKYKNGQLALAHNGNLVNAAKIRVNLENAGAIFHSTNDTEVIANLISRAMSTDDSLEDTLAEIMTVIKGSYALVLLTADKLIGVRDPLGIRPLSLGKLNDSYVFASETCAFDAVGATFVRDVKPGEIVSVTREGIKSVQAQNTAKTFLCIFEFVYFARPDSIIDGAGVCEARREAGRILATEHPVDADVVIGAPDSGTLAAIGFSQESGIPFGNGLIKNRYVGRTFLNPEQGQRDAGVKIKFNAIKSEVYGKRVVMVDDSIVRGTTTRQIIRMLKNAGAKEVHMRVSSPPYRYPCFFGIDTSSDKQLLASHNSIESIKEMICADSLGYLSLEGLLRTPKGARCGFCTACFNGIYPMEV